MLGNFRISIVLSAYNAADYIEESILSVLKQTYQYFEFIVINDGSTDKTGDILEYYRRIDSRIFVITQENAGLTKSLARGVSASKGELVARIDADDVWEPEKLAKQVAFIENHPEIGLLGTGYSLIDEKGAHIGAQDVPLITGCDAVCESLLFFNPFLHSSVIFRKTLIARCGNYDPDFSTAQDYDLWARMLRFSKGDNLAEILVRRRITKGMISFQKERKQRLAALRIKFNERWHRRQFRGAIASACSDLAVIALPRPVLDMLRNCR